MGNNNEDSGEEKIASLRVRHLGHPVTADGVSEKWRINRKDLPQPQGGDEES